MWVIMCDSRRCQRMDIGECAFGHCSVILLSSPSVAYVHIFWEQRVWCVGCIGLRHTSPDQSEATTARKSAVCIKLVVSQSMLGSQPNRNR